MWNYALSLYCKHFKMRKFLLLISLTTASLNLFSQSTNEVGTWQLVRFQPDSGQDLSRAQSIEKFMAGQSYEFDGSRYRMSWKFKVEVGSYHITNEQEILFDADQGAEDHFKMYHQSHPDTLSIGFDNKVLGKLVFARSSAQIPDLPQGDFRKAVNVNPSKLLKKWKLDSICGAGGMKEFSDVELREFEPYLATEFSTLLVADGTYKNHSTSDASKGEGTWELNDAKDAIVFDKGTITQKHYMILECTDGRLVLLDQAQKSWCYSVNE